MKYTLTGFIAPALLVALAACSAETPATQASDTEPSAEHILESKNVVETDEVSTTDIAPLPEASVDESAIADTYSVSEENEAGISTIAALVYADWCGSCKILDPAVNAARAANEFDGIEFITLDYTHRNDDIFFAKAESAGIGNAIRSRFKNNIKTGLLLVIDATTGEIISEITKTDSAGSIADKLNAL